MLKVYYACVCGLDDDTADFPLSEYRRAKLKRILNAEARKRSAGAELLLNYAVRSLYPDCTLPLKIEWEDGGKPYLPNATLKFNLSHSGDYAACAVSESEVGIDIQSCQKCRTELAGRFFAADEQEALKYSKEPDQEFTKLWSLKESFIKAVGKGLALPLSSFSVISGAGTKGWFFNHTVIGDYHISVCSREKDDNVLFEQIKLL